MALNQSAVRVHLRKVAGGKRVEGRGRTCARLEVDGTLLEHLYKCQKTVETESQA